MIDAKKSAEALAKIQQFQKTIASHQSNILRFEKDKADKAKYFDQQIKNEQDRIRQCSQQIDQLKRQI